MSTETDDLEQVSDLDDPRWTRALERVMDGQGLSVVAQPIVDLAHARVGGFELLSRFSGPPERGPDVWFTAARRRGLDAELTACTLRAARAVVADRPEGTFWSVNVEPHLLPHPVVREALLGHGPLDGVVVELTEHVASTDDEGLRGSLADIRALGGRVAMDDAGTGYSGLSQMLSIRPDVVKLDRSLVAGLDRDPVRRTAVRLLGDLAGQMDAWLLAEGVETRAELAELVDLRVPLVQGWAVGRPGSGWPGLEAGTAAFLTEQAGRAGLGDHVLSLVRPAAVGDLPGQLTLDARGRPLTVVVADPAGGSHQVPAMVVAPSAPPHEVLSRAMGRPAAWQHAPVVCTDARGSVIGTVSIDGLVDHLVSARPKPTS